MADVKKHLVIGLGSGRCGTRSLARILGLSHEGYPLPWKNDEHLFKISLAKLLQTDGDVGLYWLNYVVDILAEFPDTKFICLKRDKQETIRSWIRRFDGSDRFGVLILRKDDSGKIVCQPMTKRYPGLSIEESGSRYWDEYYATARDLELRFPRRFRIFDMEKVLNDRKTQREMLRFAGVKRPLMLRCHGRSIPKKGLRIGNAIRDWIEDTLERTEIHYGQKLIINPDMGSNLGRLAVEYGISKDETDEITIDFRDLVYDQPAHFSAVA